MNPSLARALAALCGMAAVLTVTFAVSGVQWPVLIVGALAVLLAAWSRWFAFLEAPVVLVVVLAATIAAVDDRLPVPTAALLGLFLLGYVLLTDLGDALGGIAESAGATVRAAGWVRTQVALVAAGIAGAAVLAVVVVLPVPPMATVVVVTPIALFAAGMLAVGRRRP